MPRTRHPSPHAPSAQAARPHQGRGIRRGEAELLVQSVRVGGEERPAEVAARTLVDHAPHETLAELVAAMVGQDEHVGEVGEPDAVRDRSSEADLLAGAGDVDADDPPGARELRVDVGARAPAPQ